MSHTRPHLQGRDRRNTLRAVVPPTAFLHRLVDAVLPPRCIACAQPTTRGNARTNEPGPWCALCAEQITGAPPAAAAAAGVKGAFVYAGPLADAIVRAKVGRDVAVARALAAWWAVAAAPLLPPHDGVAFVPAPWQRRLRRGFDLPALLASALSDLDGARPVVDVLVARRHDARLALARSRDERAALVHGRFAARDTIAAWSGRTLLVVDDVRTTGATMGAACAVVHDAGARTVPVALALTPVA